MKVDTESIENYTDTDDLSFEDSSIANSQNSIENLKFKKRLKRTFID